MGALPLGGRPVGNGRVPDPVLTVRPIATDDLFRVRWPSQPRIAPAGDRIALTVTWLDADLDGIRSEVIWIATDGTGTPGHIAGEAHTERDPAWAADGRRLAIVSERSGRSQIWVVDVASGSIERLTEVAGEASGPSWSPDGTRIAFVATDADESAGGRTARRHVWIVDADGRGQRRITDGDTDHDLPSWHPAGDRIAFRQGGAEVWTIDPSGA